MKAIFSLLFMSLMLVATGVYAQNGAPAKSTTSTSMTQTQELRMAGSFKKGSTDTSMKGFTGSYFPSWTITDTVLLAASAGDSVWCSIPNQLNGITFETHATIYSGTSCDSVTVKFWGTITEGRGQGSMKLLQTTTLGSGTAEQVIHYTPNSGIGNPYTNYRVTVDVADLAGTCSVQHKSWVLPR